MPHGGDDQDLHSPHVTTQVSQIWRKQSHVWVLILSSTPQETLPATWIRKSARQGQVHESH